jgi:hypothetical protein
MEGYVGQMLAHGGGMRGHGVVVRPDTGPNPRGVVAGRRRRHGRRRPCGGRHARRAPTRRHLGPARYHRLIIVILHVRPSFIDIHDIP